MLQSLQTFWMSTPPDPTIPLIQWRAFGTEVLGWIGSSGLVGVALIVLLYWLFARRIVIRTPADPFLPYAPVRWLFLSFVAGLIPGIAYAIRYRTVFPQVAISPVGGALTAFLLTTLGTYLIAQLLIWIPGITPRKLLYHPRWLWRRLRRNP